MKDFISKEHYCNNINTLLPKSNAYPLSSIGNPHYGLTPIFTRQFLPLFFYDFSQISAPYK